MYIVFYAGNSEFVMAHTWKVLVIVIKIAFVSVNSSTLNKCAPDPSVTENNGKFPLGAGY